MWRIFFCFLLLSNSALAVEAERKSNPVIDALMEQIGACATREATATVRSAVLRDQIALLQAAPPPEEKTKIQEELEILRTQIAQSKTDLANEAKRTEESRAQGQVWRQDRDNLRMKIFEMQKQIDAKEANP